jgi:chromosome segregation and condensation protein ScpB
VETLLARRLIEEDTRFGGRGRPAFLITTSNFLRRFGLTSLSDLPPRQSGVTEPARAFSSRDAPLRLAPITW